VLLPGKITYNMMPRYKYPGAAPPQSALSSCSSSSPHDCPASFVVDQSSLHVITFGIFPQLLGSYEAHDMTDQPRDYLKEGGISLAFVVPIQLAYCTLEWRALATQPERRHRLLFTIFCASIFNSLSLGFLIAGSMSSMDEAMGLSCMGMAELSIWSTEVQP
jgi:hypothetical protein